MIITAIQDYDDVIGMLRYIRDENDEWIKKFLGKNFKLKGYLTELADSIIHYREERSHDVRAWSLDHAYSIDVTAWTCAKYYGAKWMTVYLTDVDEFYFTDAATVDSAERVVLDEREGEQFRVPWDLMEPYPFHPVPRPMHIPMIDDDDCIVLNDWSVPSTPAVGRIYVPRSRRFASTAGSGSSSL